MEQVVNGGLSSFSDPTKHISKMIRFGEDGFLAAFSEGRISTFTYNPDISSYLTELEKEEKLLPNIKESFSQEGSICVIPAAIMLPMYFTDQENMTGVSDLCSLADMMEQQRSLHPGGLQIMTGDVQVSAGTLMNAYNYAFLQSLRKTPQGEACQAALLPGTVKDAFIPVALMGISSVSKNQELAGSLLQEILSEDMQSMIYPVGFPINASGLSAYLDSLGGMLPEERQRPGEIFGGYGMATSDGELISLKLYVPDETEWQELYTMLTAVRTPYLPDAVMEDVVREAGKHYLNDRCSLQEAVEMIQKKTEIYMAE